jgi:hypothetical protein
MKPSVKKIALPVVVSTIAFLFFADEYPAIRFRGDGKFAAVQSLDMKFA